MGDSPSWISVPRSSPVPHWISAALPALLAVAVVIALAPDPRPATASASETVDQDARVVAERRIDDRTLDIAISSPSIDAAVKWVRLLLPRHWSKSASRTWPTLWLLHGGVDDNTSWTEQTDVERLVADRDVLVVIPDTSWCSAYSDWWNYGQGGPPKWETYLTTEVRKILERDYRAGTARAIAGLSMGGLGALKLAANHRGMFKAAASFSGAVDPLHEYSGGSDGVDVPGLGCLADGKRVWGDPTIPEQRAIWERNSPYNRAADLAGVRLYISSGDGLSDPLGGTPGPDLVEQQTDKESKGLAARLRELGIPRTTHFYSGKHSWPYWERELHAAAPGLLAAIGA